MCAWCNESVIKFIVPLVQDVLHRHPLYLIVRMLCYDDGLGAGKNLLALKTTEAKQEECSIWVYQCSSSVSVTKVWNETVLLDLRCFPACYLSSVWTGAGSVHLQGAVGLLRLRSDIGQVLRAEGRTGRSVKKRNETTAKNKSEAN